MPEHAVADDPVPTGAPVRAWLRPALLILGGLAVAVLLWVIGQHLAAGAMALVALFMGYWTSPARGGQHTAFGPAMAERGPDRAVILWAPGDPMSARLQTAIRGQRSDVAWVNVYRDGEAATFLAGCGGRGALPLVILGERVLRRATVGQYLDARAEAAETPDRTTEGRG